MIKRPLTIQIAVGLVLVSLYVASYSALLHYRQDSERDAHSGSGIWDLPPLALLFLAGEFKGMLANYLTLEAGAQLGTELRRKSDGGFEVVPKEYNWPSIHRIFTSSQVLDPSFAQTYIVARGWLPWEPANMVAETQEILKIADLNRPWDWQPAHAIGFNTYYFLKQPGEAGKIFLQAAQKPNAPSFLSVLGARLAQKGGQTESAIVMMKSMLADKDPEEPGYNNMVDRLHALEGVLVIEQAAKKYEKDLGHKALSLEELIYSDILKALPPNPYGLEYCMDSEGNIYFDNPDCRGSAPENGS